MTSNSQRVFYGKEPILLDADKPEIVSTEIRGSYGVMHLPSPEQVATELQEQQAELDRLIDQIRQQDSALGLDLDAAVNGLVGLIQLQTLVRSVVATDFLGQGADVLILDWPEKQ